MLRIAIPLLAAMACQAQTFEVASVRPHSGSVLTPMLKVIGASPIRISGDRIELRAVTLKELVVAAYGVKDYQGAGGPGWATSIGDMFDVDAKAPAAAPGIDQVQRMLQALLADRFHLKLRRESKQLAVYNLVIAKGGPKLKPVAADAPPVPETNRAPMEQITALWSLYVDRPVLDKTGLAGLFDFPVRLWQLDTNIKDLEDLSARAFTAIQDELGLRAEAARAVIDLLIIESAAKPAAN